MASLTTYRRKRHFNVTREPPGRIISHHDGGRFVIQRHAARTLHFDLRLELAGVYKSWAVTKVPSPDPAVRRLAVQVEDHPLAYGSYEGTIPKGEYGAGTVQLWDRGHWRSLKSRNPSLDLARGHLSFVLNGKVLKGGWALVRLASRGVGSKRARWLLVKERDDQAVYGKPDKFERVVRSVKSGLTLDEISAGAKRMRRSRLQTRQAPLRR